MKSNSMVDDLKIGKHKMIEIDGHTSFKYIG